MVTKAKFTQGSTLKHILVMTSTSAIGLMALFMVDLLDMYFVSLLGHEELAAAIGFAGTLVFFNTSVSIGAAIAMGATVSKAIGAKEVDKARQLATSALLFSLLAGCAITTIMLTNLDAILALIGAKGIVAAKAAVFLNILMPSAPILSMGIAASAALRAVGDAKRSMYATLIGGIVNAALDPVLIFGLGMGIKGAAWSSVIARCCIFLYAFYGLAYKHQLLIKPTLPRFVIDVRPIAMIAIPAILANIATPFGNAFITREIAKFGTDYVAGFAVIGRLIPVCFALIFALSGAIGPILGQNYGARLIDRIQQSLNNALGFSIVYCVAISLLLWLGEDLIVYVFNLNADAVSLIRLFCPWIALSFIFNAALFIANATFNNLKRSLWATFMNAGKATFGTIPFVIIGGKMAGAEGVLIGQALGAVLFGIMAYALAQYRVQSLKTCYERLEQEEETAIEPTLPMTPFCSSRAYIFEECQVEKERHIKASE